MSLLGIAAIIGGGATVLSGVSSLFESKSNRDYNQNQTEQAMNFQREMFQKQNEEYNRRLQLEQNYNDPSQIAQRYAGIGINAGSVLAPSQGSSTVFGSPSPSVSPAPSAPSPAYVNMSANGDTASYMEKIGSLLSHISSSQKDSVEAQNVSRMADDLLKNLELRNRLEAQNIMDKELEVIVKKNTALEKAFNDLRLQRADLNYKIISGQNVEIDSELKQWNIFATQAKEKLDSASYLKLMETLPLEIQNLRAYALTLKEQANNYRALTAKTQQETKTEEWNTKIAEIEADLNDTTKANKLETLIAEYASRADKARAAGLYAKLEKQRLELITAIKNKNWKKVDAVLNYMKSLSPDLISITGAAAK